MTTSFMRKKKDKVFNLLKEQLDVKEDERSTKKDGGGAELYVDKHRQAAVTLGERDVATDVRAKKRRDRSASGLIFLCSHCSHSRKTGKKDTEDSDEFEYLIYLSQVSNIVKTPTQLQRNLNPTIVGGWTRK